MLLGVKIIEFEGLGPAPFAGRMLAELGADVLVIKNAGQKEKTPKNSLLNAGKKSVFLNLKYDNDYSSENKYDEDVEKLRDLVDKITTLLTTHTYLAEKQQKDIEAVEKELKKISKLEKVPTVDELITNMKAIFENIETGTYAKHYKKPLEDWFKKPNFSLSRFVAYKSSPTIWIFLLIALVNLFQWTQSFSAKGSSIDLILNLLTNLLYSNIDF